MRPSFRSLRLLAAAVCLSGCSLHRASASAVPKNIPTAKGDRKTAFSLQFVDVAIGAGARVTARQCVYAHYTGWLTDGTKFDSSRDTMPNGKPKSPLAFPLGVRRVISGWDLGFDGMQVGGQRRLFIPYQLAYGEAGRPPVIPAKAALIFDVELLAVADTLATSAPSVRPDSAPRRPAPAGPQCPTWAAVSAK
jgi:peptidylprolyl isomerase